MYSEEAQQWLSEFCASVESAEWYNSNSNDCLMDRFVAWMETDCSGSQTTCCGYNASDFPYDEAVAETCIRKAAELSTDEDWGPGGFWFKVEGDRDLKALVLTFESNIEFSEVYADSRKFDNKLTKWLDKELKSAPKSMEKAFFVSDFEFYSLQDAIGTGAYESAVAATVIAVLVLLVMSRFNLCVTIFAGITIGSVVVSITGLLAFQGWELSVINSVIFSCAIGMSIDFVAHLSHAFGRSLARGLAPLEAVQFSIIVMGPSVTAAALSTTIAGGVMLLSVTLFYYSYGLFLVYVMLFSWSYSVFFLVPLLGVAGPIVRWCGCGDMVGQRCCASKNQDVHGEDQEFNFRP
mmetsp:Transcript_14220/g.41905  ORF Transcript_14220/g.41905 Transcript_14220/m.41905 type:complete len:350 (-) Transcript_14220:34-1083(-)